MSPSRARFWRGTARRREGHRRQQLPRRHRTVPRTPAILAVVGKLMTDFADAFAAWADWATSVLADWPDDPADAEPDRATFEAIARGGTTAPINLQSKEQP